MPPMNRRDALKATTALLGGVLFTSSGVLAACARGRRAASASVLSPEREALAEEIADTILPTTAASPGAKAAGAGATMNLLLTDCRAPDEQRRVVEGLDAFRDRCAGRCPDGFAAAPRATREALVREVDAEARAAGEGHWFGVVRDLAMQAYFTSEIGMTRALRYVQTPGRWVGCLPLEPGQPAWG